MEVPVIDISSWVVEDLPINLSNLSSQQLEVSKQWDFALHTLGAAIIVGHGVPATIFDRLHQHMNHFFSCNDMDNKLRYHHGGYGNSKGGYTPSGMENVSASMKITPTAPNQQEGQIKAIESADPVESFVISQSSPYLQANLEDLLLEGDEPMIAFLEDARTYFHEHVEKVLRALHYISAAALGMEDLAYFHNYYDHRTCQWTNEDDRHAPDSHNGNALRFAYYPFQHSNLIRLDGKDNIFPNDGTDGTNLRYGAHTDYQGYTILKPDLQDWQRFAVVTDQNEVDTLQFGGLEVFNPSNKEWLKVAMPHKCNGLIVNAGNTTALWLECLLTGH
jgi:isopenicillin N synthase-like dioxygenase